MSLQGLHLSFSCIPSVDVRVFTGRDLRPSGRVALTRNINRMITILDSQDLTNHRRYVDQVQFNVSGQSELIPSVVSRTNTTGSYIESRSEPNEVREGPAVTEDLKFGRSERLSDIRRNDYRHPEQNLVYGRCDMHE